MLVLSRKENESIIIANTIEIQIIETKRGQVKIGIIAPKGINIYRKEVYEEVKSENIKATEINLEILKKFLK